MPGFANVHAAMTIRLPICCAVASAIVILLSQQAGVLSFTGESNLAFVWRKRVVFPASTLTVDEKAKLTADADRLVANASLRAQGGSPDRKTGRAAAEKIGKMSQSGKFSSDDAAKLKQDLKSLQAAAQ